MTSDPGILTTLRQIEDSLFPALKLDVWNGSCTGSSSCELARPAKTASFSVWTRWPLRRASPQRSCR